MHSPRNPSVISFFTPEQGTSHNTSNQRPLDNGPDGAVDVDNRAEELDAGERVLDSGGFVAKVGGEIAGDSDTSHHSRESISNVCYTVILLNLTVFATTILE